jgi:hypothetical protein
MPLYMKQFAYTPEAWATLTQNSEDRSEANVAENVLDQQNRGG